MSFDNLFKKIEEAQATRIIDRLEEETRGKNGNYRDFNLGIRTAIKIVNEETR